MTFPDIEKGGKACRDMAKNLRRRAKAKGLTTEEGEWIAAWEARVAAMPKGRPVKDSQSEPDAATEGAAGKTEDPPSPDPEPAAPGKSAEPPPPVEAPPRVMPSKPIEVTHGADWRAKHRAAVNFSGDGRQMLCESLADAWADGLGALVDDMRKAGIEPFAKIDPRMPNMKSIAVLAFDELLPEKAKLSPKVGLLVITTATIGKRAYHHKAITAALKNDPATIEWQKKQAEREAADRATHAARAEQAKAAEAPPVQYAEPPPAPEPERPVNGKPFQDKPREVPDRDSAPLV